MLAILFQIPPAQLQRYILLAAQHTDDDSLAAELLRLARQPEDTERRLAQSVSTFLAYTTLPQ